MKDEAATDGMYPTQNLIVVLERQYKSLEAADASPEILYGYRRILSYLRRLPASEWALILKTPRSETSELRDVDELPSGEDILNFSAEEIEAIARNKETRRRVLDRIAMVRFGVTKGGLSNLRTREALVEKLLTMLSHEATHRAIDRAAGKAGS